MGLRWLAVCIVIACATGSGAAGAPAAAPLRPAAARPSWEAPLFPDHGCWGVVVHTPNRGDALKALGVQWVRLGLRWNHIEKGSKGNYDWTEADGWIKHYQDRGLGVMGLLTLEDLCPLYEADKENKEVVIAAIARWCGAAAARYRGRGILWELSNEPEVFPMGGYWNDPKTYAAMARQAARAIKRADPQARVAALSVAWMDRDFINTALASGLLDDGTIDVLTYHGYHRRNLTPESGLEEDLGWLRQRIARYGKGRQIIPADSERGYAIVPFLQPKAWHSWRNMVYSESEQAAYLARHYLESIAQGVEIAVWYKDMSGEANFSLWYGDETDPRGLRPMGHVYRNLATLLPENPKRLVNDRYDVSLVDLRDQNSAPDGTLTVRTYLRSYLQRGEKQERLVIAAWNPVEAFDGRILDNRKQIGDDYYEAWRAVSPSDRVAIPVQVAISGLVPDRVKSAATYDLLARTTDEAAKPLELDTKSGRVLTPVLQVGPMPTVVVLDLAADGK